MSVVGREKKGIREVVPDFFGFSSINLSVCGVRDGVKCIISSQPNGSGILVKDSEGCGYAVVSSLVIGFVRLHRANRCKTEPREGLVSAEKVVPADFVLLRDGVIDGLMVERRKRVKGGCEGSLGICEKGVDRCCETDAIWMRVLVGERP